jgi:hypothetical protein
VGIDYIIHYECEPKRALTVEGLMGYLKGRERAHAIIDLYRDNGDLRPPSEMGFEMVRRTVDGGEDVEIIVVQDLLDAAEALTPWEPVCEGCPANRAGVPFGCVGSINYPLSSRGERWLLDQLPGNDHPLPFVLLQKAIFELGYTGESAARLRAQEGIFLESTRPLERNIDGIVITGDQVFEIFFLSGPIQPAHGSMLLQFSGAISQDLDADQIMQLGLAPSAEWIAANIPFRPRHEPGDGETIAAVKTFLHALYVAFGLGVPLLLDV